MNIGTLGSMYFWVNTLCRKEDIVVFMDADDYFVSPFTLQILNAKYQNQDIWVAYSRFLMRQNGGRSLDVGPNRVMTVPSNRYRNSIVS
jgi:hypothetical protein